MTKIIFAFAIATAGLLGFNIGRYPYGYVVNIPPIKIETNDKRIDIEPGRVFCGYQKQNAREK